MFQTRALKAKATARPVRSRGVARTRVKETKRSQVPKAPRSEGGEGVAGRVAAEREEGGRDGQGGQEGGGGGEGGG